MSNNLVASRTGKIVKSDAEWRAQLTPEQYREATGLRYSINGAALAFKPGDT